MTKKRDSNQIISRLEKQVRALAGARSASGLAGRQNMPPRTAMKKIFDILLHKLLIVLI
jgi:hypothetical protein